MKPTALVRLTLPIVLGSMVAICLATTNHGYRSHGADRSAPDAPAVTRQDAIRYGIDPSKSRFTVRAFVGGLFSAFGHDHTIAVRDFSGEASVAPDTLEPASLQMTIKSASLAVIDKVSEKDRKEIEDTMRKEVLDTSNFPEIVFKSTRVSANRSGDGRYSVKIWGDLTLHGVTRSGLINAQVTIIGNSLRAVGEFPLRQTDYGIKPVTVAAGTIKVKDELKLSFDIVCNRG
jgi:polyisoprenoid-binding protein YceI